VTTTPVSCRSPLICRRLMPDRFDAAVRAQPGHIGQATSQEHEQCGLRLCTLNAMSVSLEASMYKPITLAAMIDQTRDILSGLLDD
jgi:hypothetical protein